MTFRIALFATALLALSLQAVVVHGYYTSDPHVTCQTQSILGKDQRICATTYLAWQPDPTNGTIYGSTGFHYHLYKGVPPNTDTSAFTEAQNDEHLLGYTIDVTWWEEDQQCAVTVGGKLCSDCSLCHMDQANPAETTMSADCTNIGQEGRKLTCEKAYILFPLKESKRYSNGIGKKLSPMTYSPTPAPTKAPFKKNMMKGMGMMMKHLRT